MKIFITISIIAMVCLIISCSKQSSNTPDAPGTPPPPSVNCEGISAKFVADIMPIIQTKCATGSNCHGEGSLSGPGALTSFDKIRNNAARIKSAVNSRRMPLVGSLSGLELQQINCWVDGGSLSN